MGTDNTDKINILNYMQTFRIKLLYRITLLIFCFLLISLLFKAYSSFVPFFFIAYSLFTILAIFFTLIFLLYKLVIDLAENSIKEFWWGRIKRTIIIGDIISINHTRSARNLDRYNLIGNFPYKHFPTFNVGSKFLDAILVKNPQISVDEYFVGSLSGQSRQMKRLNQPLTDRIANYIGLGLYGILFIIIASIGIITVSALLIGLYRLITGQLTF